MRRILAGLLIAALAVVDGGCVSAKCDDAATCSGGGGMLVPDAATDAADASACPSDVSAEGTPCAQGLSCEPFGAFSCPMQATCDATGHWSISCPKYPVGSDGGISCSCPHPQ